MNASLALKTCEHCGRENDQGATICIGCGFTSLKPLITIADAEQSFLPMEDQPVGQKSAFEFDQCQNVIASARGLVETDHGKQVQFIPRETITDVSLYYGCAAHRPVLETIFGCLLLVVGVFGLWNLLAAGTWSYDLALMGLGVLGSSMLLDVFRNYYFLRITTETTHFKIKFETRARADEIESFCERLADRWHYRVND
jgi:hypothetical protein